MKSSRLSRWLRCSLAVLCLTTVIAHAGTTNFFEGFETSLSPVWSVGDANASGTPAYWSIVDSAFGGEGAQSGTRKIYCAGFGYAGSTNSPTYRDSMRAYLQRGIDLTGYSNATLSFWFKLPSVESGYDSANVYLDSTLLWSSDSPATNWTQVSLSLDAFVGGAHTLKFEFTSDTTVTAEGWYLDDILVVSGPGNDAFASARTLTGGFGSVTNNNSGASSEPGEPHPGNSIWYRWLARTNGAVTFRTGGSSFDTLLCIYAGTNLLTLTNVACNDNGDSNNASLVSFIATNGVTYSLSVRGVASAEGTVVLSWDQPNGHGLDLLPDLSVWASQPNAYLYGWYLDRNQIPGRVLLRLSTATPNTGPGPLELHGSSTTPGVSQRIFRDDGTWWERYAGTFTFHSGHQHLHFDNWLNFHLRSNLVNDAVGDIIVSGDKTSFAIIDLTHYNPALPGSPASGRYGGGLVQGLSVGWADVYGANLTDQWIDVTDMPAGRYWLEAIVDPANSILESDESNNTSRILIDLDLGGAGPSTNGPANNFFTNAFVLSGVMAARADSNSGATREAGEPNHAGNSGGPSVWFRWTAPSNMNVTLTTEGSSFDTTLGVYTGASVSSLSLVVSNDDVVSGTLWSRATFAAISNTTYRIAVDGYNGANGSYELNLNPAWNDQFASSLVLTGASGTVSGSTRGATRQAGETNHAGVFGSNSIWFSWTAPLSGEVIMQTIGSGFDTLLGIYTGSSVSALALVAADDNSAGSGASRVTFSAVAGTTYRIAIDGPAGARGLARLTWAGPTAPAILIQPLSTNLPAGSAAAFSVTAIGSAPLVYQWRHQGTNLADNLYASGTHSPVLSFNKVQSADAGVYTVVITNAYGSVTSAPGNLIVLDNPRVVFVEETSGHSGAFVRVPVEMQSLGNEHAVSFSLIFDPAVLSNPRATNVPAGAALVLNTNQLGGGVLGVLVTLPVGAVFATGDVTVAQFIFDTAPSAVALNTFAGFGLSPTPRLVTDTNGVTLPALFVAGVVHLEPLRLASSGMSNGTFRLSFGAVNDQRYAVDASGDLINWTPLATNTAVGSSLQFTDTNALPRRFYRARPGP